MQSACLGLGYVRKDTFYHFSHSGVFIWNLNRYFSTFLHVSSPTLIIQRCIHPTKEPRLLTVTEDGAVRLISPVNGKTLTVGFPVHRDIVIIEAVYDHHAEVVYLLSKTGNVITYAVNTNPGRVIGICKQSKLEDQCLVIAGFEIYNMQRTPNPLEERHSLFDSPEKFMLLGGSNSGQIVQITVNGATGLEKVVTQAHAAPIISLRVDTQRMQVITTAKDHKLKIWKAYARKHTEDTANILILSSCKSSLALYLVSVVELDSSLTTFYTPSIDFENQIIGLGAYNGIYRFAPDGRALAKPLDNMEDEGNEVTGISFLPNFRLWATGCFSGSVKIWDEEGLLVREIQFSEPIKSICFLNQRGDIVVGLREELALLKMQNYLPLHILSKFQNAAIKDDPVEETLPFDEGVDFWACFVADQKRIYGDKFAWHVRVEKLLQEDDFDDFEDPGADDMLDLAQIQKRHYDIAQRKFQKMCLEMERDNFVLVQKKTVEPTYEAFKVAKVIDVDEDDLIFRSAAVIQEPRRWGSSSRVDQDLEQSVRPVQTPLKVSQAITEASKKIECVPSKINPFFIEQITHNRGCGVGTGIGNRRG